MFLDKFGLYSQGHFVEREPVYLSQLITFTNSKNTIKQNLPYFAKIGDNECIIMHAIMCTM